MRRVLKINPIIAISLVLLITTSITLYGLRTLKDRDTADEWVTSTRTLMITIDQTLIGLVNMETGLRGYLLTGDDDFLTPYRSGKVQYETALASLFELSKGNPALEPRWQEIETLASQWVKEWAAPGIAMRQEVNAGNASHDAVIGYVSTEKGRQLMDAIRTKINEGIQIENELLARRIERQKEANNRAYWVMLTGMAFSVILGIGTGFFLARNNARNQEFIEIQKLLLEEREKERMEIARDLHDGPVQDLVAASFTIQALAVDEMPSQAASEMDEIQASIEKVIADLRAYAMELRSPVRAQFGLEKAINSHLEMFRQKYPQMRINFVAKQRGDLLPNDCRNALFRIFQEAMNNVVRHSQATEVEIIFQKKENEAILDMRDNGVGFDPPNDWLNLARHGHLGLVGIRERADAVSGHVEIQSHPGRGTKIRVVVPI